MTGLADEEFALQAIKTGADDYLMKGQISDGLLVRTIRYTMERKRAEDAVRESEEQYRIITETAQDAIITIDDQSRSFSQIRQQSASSAMPEVRWRGSR